MSKSCATLFVAAICCCATVSVGASQISREHGRSPIAAPAGQHVGGLAGAPGQSFQIALGPKKIVGAVKGAVKGAAGVAGSAVNTALDGVRAARKAYDEKTGDYNGVYYLMRNPDLQGGGVFVKPGIGINWNGLYKHYYDHGRHEKRIAYVGQGQDVCRHDGIGWHTHNVKRGIPFDPCFYSETHKDLKRVYGKNYHGLADHWVIHGMREGRDTARQFSIQSYIGNYPDLVRAIGKNWIGAWGHWYKYGVVEKRKPCRKAPKRSTCR